MKKGVIAELQSTYDTGFLTSCMEIDELVNNFKERQDEFDNGGIFVEVYDNETVMNTDVNVSKIAACIRNYTIKGDVNKDLAVMDSTAASLCKDNSLEIIVFNMNKYGNIVKAIKGEKIGTHVKK